MTYRELAENLLTIEEARKALQYKSRTSIELLITKNEIEHIIICPNTPSAVRLITKESINNYIDSKNRTHVQ